MSSIKKEMKKEEAEEKEAVRASESENDSADDLFWLKLSHFFTYSKRFRI